MKARVEIEKSFDKGKEFSKEWKFGDFQQFFEEEGDYLDKLANILADKGMNGHEFTVTYTVTVTK